jgi:hypothetical protein
MVFVVVTPEHFLRVGSTLDPGRSDGPCQHVHYAFCFGRKVQGQSSGFSQRARRTGFILM